MVVGFRDVLRVSHYANHLAHVPVILVIASASEDCCPSLFGDFGRVRKQPIEVGFASAQSSVGHEGALARVLKKSAFLGGGEYGLVAEKRGVST